MIPDFAAVRDRATGLRKKIYSLLSLGWQGTPRQWHRLETAMHIMAIAIIPVAVSVHTIVSWDFAMTPVPMWHSTIFGPYFVVGAIFSGIAALILAMALLRKFLHLEEYLQPIHFENLGKLLLTMSLLWFYFTFAERLTTWYGNDPSEMAVFWASIRQQLRAAVLDHGGLQFHHSRFRSWPSRNCARSPAPCIASIHHRRRHVARALPDHRALARTQVSALLLGHLPPHLGGDHADGRRLRHDGAALPAVLEVRAHDLHVGVEGRCAQSPHASASRRLHSNHSRPARRASAKREPFATDVSR